MDRFVQAHAERVGCWQCCLFSSGFFNSDRRDLTCLTLCEVRLLKKKGGASTLAFSSLPSAMSACTAIDSGAESMASVFSDA